MSALEFVEWTQYYKLEPWGEDRADLRQAITSLTIAAANTPKGKRKPELKSFIPKFDTDAIPEPDDDVLAKKIMGVFGQMPAIDLREPSDGLDDFAEAIGEMFVSDDW